MAQKEKYIPALKYHWLTDFYDWLIAAFLPEKKFKTDLILQANFSEGHNVLDFGCGTATLILMANEFQHKANFTGIDVDEKILNIARKKISSLKIKLDRYDGDIFPYRDSSFDRVISSLVFHHLTKKQKENALLEIKRVLKPGGELHVADWGKARNFLMRGLFFMEQLWDGFETTTDNAKGLLPDYF